MTASFFCSTCGAGAVQGMNYCKQCGGQIRQTSEVSPRSKEKYELVNKAIQASYHRPGRGIAALAWSTAVIVICGLGVILGTFIPLAAMTPGPILGVVMIAALTMLGAVALMMIRQMSRLIGAQIATAPAPLPALPSSSAAPTPYPPQLGTGPVGMPSVTEGTTRIFDPSSRAERG